MCKLFEYIHRLTCCKPKYVLCWMSRANHVDGQYGDVDDGAVAAVFWLAVAKVCLIDGDIVISLYTFVEFVRYLYVQLVSKDSYSSKSVR